MEEVCHSSSPNEDSPQLWTFFRPRLCRLYCICRTLYKEHVASVISGSSFSNSVAVTRNERYTEETFAWISFGAMR